MFTVKLVFMSLVVFEWNKLYQYPIFVQSDAEGKNHTLNNDCPKYCRIALLFRSCFKISQVFNKAYPLGIILCQLSSGLCAPDLIRANLGAHFFKLQFSKQFMYFLK